MIVTLINHIMDKKERVETNEEVKTSKDMAEEVLSKERDSEMELVLTGEDFTDEQRGQIKAFMRHLYNLGREHGQKISVLDAIGEEKFNDIVGSFSKIADTIGKSSEEKYKYEAWLYARLYHLERHVNTNREAQIMTLVEDKDRNSFGMLTPCRGIATV